MTIAETKQFKERCDSFDRNSYTEHLTRWLQARRDHPGVDVGPEPRCFNLDLRQSVIREFERSEIV